MVFFNALVFFQRCMSTISDVMYSTHLRIFAMYTVVYLVVYVYLSICVNMLYQSRTGKKGFHVLHFIAMCCFWKNLGYISDMDFSIMCCYILFYLSSLHLRNIWRLLLIWCPLFWYLLFHVFEYLHFLISNKSGL